MASKPSHWVLKACHIPSRDFAIRHNGSTLATYHCHHDQRRLRRLRKSPARTAQLAPCLCLYLLILDISTDVFKIGPNSEPANCPAPGSTCWAGSPSDVCKTSLWYYNYIFIFQKILKIEKKKKRKKKKNSLPSWGSPPLLLTSPLPSFVASPLYAPPKPPYPRPLLSLQNPLSNFPPPALLTQYFYIHRSRRYWNNKIKIRLLEKGRKQIRKIGKEGRLQEAWRWGYWAFSGVAVSKNLMT